MPTPIATGTTTTDGTEQVLTTDTSNKTYVFAIDTNAMANADQIEIKIKTKILSGGTERIAYSVQYANVQGEPQKYSMPVPENISISVTLKRIAGTDRAYPWKLLSL